MKLRINRKDTKWLICHILLSTFFVLILVDAIDITRINIFYIAYIYTIFFAFTIYYATKIKPFTAGMMIVYYIFIQGTGIPFANLFVPEYVAEQLNRSLYFSGKYMDNYISLILLSVSCILIGIILFGTQDKPIEIEEKIGDLYHKKIFFLLGLISLCFFACYMVFSFITGQIVIGDYAAYKAWSGTVLRNYSQICFWISSVFICASGNRKQIFSCFLIYLFPAAIMLMSGNRNDVLFPLLIGLGIYYLRYKRIPRILFVIIFVVVFMAGPVIIHLRNGGNVTFSDMFINIRNSIGESLFELGAQLHAVSNMFSWLERGEDYALGATFFLGFLASILRRIFPSIVTYYETSRYYILDRVPSLGFSISAEVFFNFSVIGVIVIFILLGKIMGKYEGKIDNLNKLIWYGFFMLWLLILVRNSFGYSLVYFKVFIVLFLFERITYYLLLRDFGAIREAKFKDY